MKKNLQLVTTACIILIISACSQNANNLTGAGSSFIYPTLSVWAKDYAAQTGVKINYQPIGSEGGFQQLDSHTVDFGASDIPLTLEKLRKHKLQQFPIIIGGIVIALNVPSVKNNTFVLNGKSLAKIYLGKIKYWDDPILKKLNPTLSLPHHSIIIVHRVDGSGTTFNFTHYLANVSPTWKNQVGVNAMVAWPDVEIGAKGNAGAATQIMQTPYSIGYISYAYAVENHMVITKMKNQARQIVTASSKTFAAAEKNAKWSTANGYYLTLTNQPGKNSWPIVATSFILLPEESLHPKVQQQLLTFFRWCYQHGATAAHQLVVNARPLDTVASQQQ